jgi:hypothetical protein
MPEVGNEYLFAVERPMTCVEFDTAGCKSSELFKGVRGRQGINCVSKWECLHRNGTYDHADGKAARLDRTQVHKYISTDKSR